MAAVPVTSAAATVIVLSEVFIALMKNKDAALSQKFIAVFKQIK